MLSRATDAQFRAAFGAFDLPSRSSVVVGVSGGSDSLALLLSLKDHLDDRAPGTAPVAVTIDHSLRQGSAAEAAAVARLCEAHGIAHRTLRWSGERPAAGVQDAARLARHRLLAAAAREAGTDMVAVAHTLNDQAETAAMRRARGDAGLGAAGIAPATLFERRTWFVRPFLTLGREALRDLLRKRGIAWLEDPGNSDRRFERVRVRDTMSGKEVSEHAAVADAAGRERAALSVRAAELVRRHAAMVAPGLLRLGRGALEEDPAACAHAMRALFATMGGAARPADADAVAAFLGRAATDRRGFALAGAVAVPRRDGIHLHRELRGTGSPEFELRDGLRDGRFETGAEGRFRSGHATDAEAVPAGLARAAERAEPHGAACAGLRRVVSPYARFLPSFDLALAQAIGAAIGAVPLPDAPLAAAPCESHNRFYA